ncbi:hypothetical protein IE53DRAFT_181864 [Violaceomyces palustris]|uniref:Uncharacterized protein n=1 Tax=Violaceomyces palustris TaxID=1673888 RepID=A0ACD0P5Z2_9BASI|nr:hypothetical protein IE53DRAFT_181864 [Violaceomyces palustris]
MSCELTEKRVSLLDKLDPISRVHDYLLTQTKTHGPSQKGQTPALRHSRKDESRKRTRNQSSLSFASTNSEGSRESEKLRARRRAVRYGGRENDARGERRRRQPTAKFQGLDGRAESKFGSLWKSRALFRRV